MKVAALSLLLLTAAPLSAGDWRINLGTGPFVFGNLAEKKSTISNSEQTVHITSSISAATRPGASVDLERDLNSRFSLRLGSTFTRSPVAVKTKSSNDDPSSDGVNLDVGDLNVTTLDLAAVFRFNSGGSLRPYIFAGPGYAIYNMKSEPDGPDPLFEGTRGRLGAVAGAGLEWWWRENFAVRAELSDVYTQALLKRSDFSGPTPESLELSKPHNVHTVFGITYRF